MGERRTRMRDQLLGLVRRPQRHPDSATADLNVPTNGDAPAFGRGIAYVHGVGEQKRGESLTTFAETIGLWLQQWLTGKPDADLRVTRHELEPPTAAVGAAISETVLTDPEDSRAPAHTVLTICRDGAEDERVLLAECWWAEAFEPPKLRELIVWILFIAPRLVMSQTSAPLRRSWRRAHMVQGVIRAAFVWLRMIPQLVFLLSSFVLIPLLVLVFVAILVPAVIPIASLRDAARRAATLLIGYLGDSFVVAMSAVRRDLVTETVQADLDWIAKKCSTFAVVAHSQGAVISHDALARKPPPNLSHFVTLGAGIEKLLRLRLLFHSDRGMFRWMWICLLAALGSVLTSFAALSAFATGHPANGLLLVVAAASCAAVMGGGMVLAFRHVPGYEELVHLDGAGSQFRWLNLYASSDPVPNGPLLDERRPWITECEVFNYASIIRDHTSYLKNKDDVVPRLVMTLLEQSMPEFEQDTRSLKRARTRRRIRVRALTIGRALSLAAGIATTIVVWGSLDTFGHTVRRHLPHLLLRPLRHLFAVLPHTLNTPEGRGTAAWIVAWLLVFAVFTLILSSLGRLDARLLILRKEPMKSNTAYLRVLAIAVASALILALVAVAFAAGLSGNYLLGLRVAGTVISVCIVLGGLLSRTIGPAWLDKIESWFEKRWQEQEENETYQPLAARTRGTLARLPLPGLHNP
jgi:hypothetical protein